MSDTEFIETDIVSDEDAPQEAHNKLLNAVSQLYKKQRISAPKRREPAQEISEFNLSTNAEDSGNKVHVNELLKELQEKVTHKDINTKVKAAQKTSRTLPQPLEKKEADKINRELGYQNVKKNLDKWNSVVERNKLADQLVFPLEQKKIEMEPPNFLKTFKEPSELEKAMAAVLNQSEVAQEERQVEESLHNLSIEEMIERRKMIAKMRARESYRIAKAIRQNKIKSKKYHRILKKERIKQELKDFEKLQKTDPEAALAKLEQIERARAEERISLRHRNTGKWARSRAIRAKYDTEARMQLAEQLAKSRELTRKININESSSSELEMEDEDHEENKNTNTVSKITSGSDPSNPWVKETVVDEFLNGYKQFWTEQHKSSFEEKEPSKSDKDTKIESKQTKEKEDEMPTTETQPSLVINNNTKNDIVSETLNNAVVNTDVPNISSSIGQEEDITKETKLPKENIILFEQKNNTSERIPPVVDSLDIGDKNWDAISCKQLTTVTSLKKSNEISEDSVTNTSSGKLKLDSISLKQVDLNGTSAKIIYQNKSSKKEICSKPRRSPYIKAKVTSPSPDKIDPSISKSELSDKEEETTKSYKDIRNHLSSNVGKNQTQSKKVKHSQKCQDSVFNNYHENDSSDESLVDELVKTSSNSSFSENEIKTVNETVVTKCGSWSVLNEPSTNRKRPRKSVSLTNGKSKDKTLSELFDDAEEAIQKHTSAIAKKIKEDSLTGDDPMRVNQVQKERHTLVKPLRPVLRNNGIDEALMEIHEDGISSGTNDLKSIRDKLVGSENENLKEPQIDPYKHINVKPQKLFSEIGNLEEVGDDSDDENTQKMDLMEAFADDDIADQFRKEKDEESKKNKAQEIDLELPGWGSWGGCSIPKNSKRKRRRFIVKLPEAPRKDDKKEHVIINEDPIPKLREQLVNELPYPFTSVKDYEASIRAPIGKNWVPEKAHKKLIAPPVITKMGSIIEPMSDNVNFQKAKKRMRLN